MTKVDRCVSGSRRGFTCRDILGVAVAGARPGWVWWSGWTALVVLRSAPVSAGEAARLVERGRRLVGRGGPVPQGAAEARRCFERACGLRHADGCVRMPGLPSGRSS
jgi:hypothetical protein